ncbi:ribulose-phosphate 3-epimerase [Acididesulfobacillus acetoxydans]|uniref:Ribulose-phosphate 3-epimerase n=1 Tax=Acididesulfobacillus acetoxydans TaxID=1561005 RepID=A0A8S0X6Q7_9FIRM|nr:ribulose-phosphate 3-epimerase [Acididesulfobacillus acetoxydans]CAA7602750.1 ribulose-phosphate 3-epimerase [Acididesulfobacillus acetoxydans]CEJ06393.1 Ribulose-phosphate 3-epimerase [Acididesulfobacillus acetoxydans]
MIQIAPSILSADFARLAAEVKRVEDAGADWLHIDVMDGHFVPNLTVGPALVQSLRKHVRIPFDVHLMIEAPERFVPEFVKAGADLVTIHWEATPHVHRVIQLIKSLGVRAGVALNPATSGEELAYLFDDLDVVLVMTVNPGFGGQKFIPAVVPKIRGLQRELARRSSSCLIEVDGGINSETAPIVAEAGAGILVAGAAVFAAEDPAQALHALRRAAEGAGPPI